MDLTGIMGTVGLIALTLKVLDFLKNLTSGKAGLNSVVTQLCAWVAGIVAVFLYGESQLGDGVVVGSITLDHADTATKIIIGLSIASVGSAVFDFKKAFDRSDSAKQPSLTSLSGEKEAA
jgi:hypothetical protein